AGDGEAERIGAAARHVALIERDAVTRAHHAARQSAAGAVVVAHLDGALKPAARTGISRPVQRGDERFGAIAGAVAEIFASVEFWRADNFPGIEQMPRIEAALHLLERMHKSRPEHSLVEFRAHDAVAVFAGMRALVFAHHGESFLGNGAHGA